MNDNPENKIEQDENPVEETPSTDAEMALDPEATLTLSEAERRQLELLDANNRALRFCQNINEIANHLTLTLVLLQKVRFTM